MNITSGQKTAALVGGLLIVGAAAFVYIDPMGLDLLGLNPAPVAKPSVAKKAPQPPAETAAKAPVTEDQKTTPVPKSAVLEDMLKAPSRASAMKPAIQSAVSAMPKTPNAKAPPPVAGESAMQEPEMASASKVSDTIKPKSTANTPYPPSMDLRHCLDQATPQEIAKCAGE